MCLSSKDVLRGRHTSWFTVYKAALRLRELKDLAVASQPAQGLKFSKVYRWNLCSYTDRHCVTDCHLLDSFSFSCSGNALVSFINKLETVLRLNAQWREPAQVRVRRQTYWLTQPARHAADGEDRPAWPGAPGSRRELLEPGTVGTLEQLWPAQPTTWQDGMLATFLHGCPNRNNLSG